MRNVELTFKEIIISVLHKWKLILLITVVCMIFIAGFSFNTRSREIERLQDTYEKESTAYTEALNAKLSSIAHLNEVAKAANIYNERSLLMKVDPYHKQVANIIFNVEVDPDSFYLDISNQKALGFIDLGETLVRGIVNRYYVLSSNAKLSDLLSSVMSTAYDETYLREIISFQVGEGILTISVLGSEGVDAEAVAEAVFQYLLDKKPLVSSLVHEHELAIVDKSVNYLIDTQLADLQFKQRSLASDTSEQITKVYQEIEELEKSKPVPPTLWPFVIRNAGFGLLLGLVLSVVLAVLLYLAKMPVQFASQIQKQLGVRFLGGVKPGKKGLCVTRLKNRLAGEQLLRDEPEGFRLAGANIAQLAGSHRRILVTGTLAEPEIAQAAKRLAAQLEEGDVALAPSASVNQSADAVNSLAQSDAVVLVERLHQSRLRDVLMEKERVELAGKPILGYVLV